MKILEKVPHLFYRRRVFDVRQILGGDMTKTRITSSVVLAITLLFAASCSKSTSDNLKERGQQIFGDRWATRTKVLVVVKLKSPALLTLAEKKDGKITIDPEVRQAFEHEQQRVIDSVLALSSEIKLIYRYRLTVNGFTVQVPVRLVPQIIAIGGVQMAINDVSYPLEVVPVSGVVPTADVITRNPVKFIGAERVHNMTVTNAAGEVVNLTGAGVRVGVIDTGVDFTHAMFGGAGTPAAYRAVNGNSTDPGFPNKKVVGGIDLVGDEFDSGSRNEDRTVPHPDVNPLDQGGHGSHVAGTIAGIGDGKTSYSGVAPDASLYAIRVFGRDGSTSLSQLLASFEYSADPNLDMDPSDRLDVINLSLGSPYGWSRRFEGEAIQNLTDIGTVVVTSAGNSGDTPYIVGGMSVNDNAFSIAASIDDSDHNILFPTIAFSGALARTTAERIEGSISKPVDEIGPVSGKLVDIGLALEELKEPLASQLKGHVALIERGQVPFLTKAENAFKAGAIGAIIVNNVDGDPVSPGGSGTVPIPVVAIKKDLGAKIREAMKTGDVLMEFQAPEMVERKDRIDAITGFSSRGPRSYDSKLKPDIAAPGESIISADVGGGAAVVKMSGTSMAAPMMSGVMALMKQAFPTLTVTELKAIVMGTAKPLELPISRQGAGRVQVDKAVTSTMVADRESISLGRVQMHTYKEIQEQLTFKWITTEAKLKKKFDLKFEGRHPGLSVAISSPMVSPEGRISYNLTFRLQATKMQDEVEEMDGWLTVNNDEGVVYRVPVLAVARKIAKTKVSAVEVKADALEGSEDSATTVSLTNPGSNAGEVWLFNLINTDGRKKAHGDPTAVNFCDLEAAGYRIVNKTVNGRTEPYLQIAAKLFQPMTTFNHCELSVLFGEGSPADLTPVQELARVPFDRVKGLSSPQNLNKFANVLMDFAMMRKIRTQAEVDAKAGTVDDDPNYAPAVITASESRLLSHTTVEFVEAPIALLKRSASGDFAIRIAALQEEEDTTEADDFLAGTDKQWIHISGDPKSQSFVGFPEAVVVKAGETRTLNVKKGFGHEKVMALYPQNAAVLSDVVRDQQMEIIEPSFALPQMR